MIPPQWSPDAADFINRLLIRKPANRLGILGSSEIKEHPWLKNFKWKDLYDRKLISPYIPKGTDNFDAKYCNQNDKISEQTKGRYELHLKEDKIKKSFKGFEFFPEDEQKVEFINPHLKLTNTGEENILIEKQKTQEIKSAFEAINKVQQNMPTTYLIKQYQQKSNFGYNKRKNNHSVSVEKSQLLKASGIGLNGNYSNIIGNNSFVNMNNSAVLEHH